MLPQGQFVSSRELGILFCIDRRGIAPFMNSLLHLSDLTLALTGIPRLLCPVE